MIDAAVIFDVDGPLLELTEAESVAFFVPFRETFGLTGLSDDWDGYRLRNDVEIYREILENAGLTASEAVFSNLHARYLAELEAIYASDDAVVPIPGALSLLETLSDIKGLALGTATANFESAAALRLRRVHMWDFVKDWHSGAEGGGAKRDILARVMKRLKLPAERVVFLGDNLNDLDAARTNGTHFIGFHTDAKQQQKLADAGATLVTGDHKETLKLIRRLLDL